LGPTAHQNLSQHPYFAPIRYPAHGMENALTPVLRALLNSLHHIISWRGRRQVAGAVKVLREGRNLNFCIWEKRAKKKGRHAGARVLARTSLPSRDSRP
jgi:hypothetical protein